MRFNWSKSFVSYLYALCREYYDLIESKKSDSKAWKEKDENWAEILGHIDARSKIDDPESILKKSNCVDKRSVHKKAVKVYSDKKKPWQGLRGIKSLVNILLTTQRSKRLMLF